MKVAENVEPSQILYYVQAMVNTFLANGNYENRGKARTRYMQEKLGSEGYVKAFLEKLEEVKKNEKLDLNLAVSGTEKAGDADLQTDNKRQGQAEARPWIRFEKKGCVEKTAWSG